MILIKEITSQNMRQFAGMPANIFVVVPRGHMQSMVGIIVLGNDAASPYFFVQFMNGETSPSYNTVFELIADQRGLSSFYYIEVKKQI